MMNVLIVYDSYFGNTEKVARAVEKALKPEADVSCRRAEDVSSDDLEGLDIIIAGSPTRAFSPSPAVKKFLRSIPGSSLQGIRSLAFDTRIAVEETGPAFLKILVKIFGYAAKPIASSLARKGAESAAPPEGFIVTDTEGPLREGEEERAAAWAAGALLKNRE